MGKKGTILSPSPKNGRFCRKVPKSAIFWPKTMCLRVKLVILEVRSIKLVHFQPWIWQGWPILGLGPKNLDQKMPILEPKKWQKWRFWRKVAFLGKSGHFGNFGKNGFRSWGKKAPFWAQVPDLAILAILAKSAKNGHFCQNRPSRPQNWPILALLGVSKPGFCGKKSVFGSILIRGNFYVF